MNPRHVLIRTLPSVDTLGYATVARVAAAVLFVPLVLILSVSLSTTSQTNLLPLLTAGARPVSRTLFWRVATAGLNQRAVRDGDWKLLIDGTARVMLFDVSKDLGERSDVVTANAAVVKRLHDKLLAWEKDVDAEAKTRSLTRGPQ